MRRKIVAGNWKMNGSKAFIERYVSELKSSLPQNEAADVAVFVPFLYLGMVQDAFSDCGVIVGAQNIAAYESGAYTGEVSGTMLADVGCQWVLVGHSERRALFSESDEAVLAKVTQAISCNINVVLCVGETLDEREAGKVDEVVGSQIKAVFDNLSVSDLSNVLIAYEPVWAIGTGKTATPDQAQEVHAMIRNVVAQKDPALAEKVQILYGGSVKPENAAEIFSKPDVDGGLVGGASLSASDFIEIINAAG